MAGRRLIDAAKLFNASKSIAQQHIKLRSQQLDVFSKTSSLAKAAKSQTDRITVTLEAARALSRRLNEEAPKYAEAAQRATASYQDTRIPRKESAREGGPRENVKTGLEQDHHYDASRRNTKAEPPTEEELSVQQEEAERAPLPDGTIPSTGVTLDKEPRGQDTFNEHPVPEPPKEPLAEGNPQRTALPEQDAVPPGINTDVFRTRKVAKMLGENPYQQKPHLNLKNGARTPHDHTKISQVHDQDTFNVQGSAKSRPSKPTESASQVQRATTEKEIRDFASQLAKDAEAAQPIVSEVWTTLQIRHQAC